MKSLQRWWTGAGRGVAAVEFALTFPVILYLFAGVTDLGLVYYRQCALSTAVGAAAEYALLQDQNSGGVTEANVRTVLSGVAAQSMPNASVTPAAACYCVSGTATTAWSTTDTSVSCSSACATGSKYAYLSLSTSYTPILPWSMLSSPTTLSKTAWIPMQQ